jgi:hypothetical protein
LEYTDVSEVHTASIIRAVTASMIALMMEAVRTSETSVYSNETIGRYIPAPLIFILAAVRT